MHSSPCGAHRSRKASSVPADSACSISRTTRARSILWKRGRQSERPPPRAASNLHLWMATLDRPTRTSTDLPAPLLTGRPKIRSMGLNCSQNLEQPLQIIKQSYYFDRDDVALRHFAEFFKEQSHEEREHAEKLLKFQNRRGGRIILEDIKKPEQDEWSNGLEVMQRALQMEKNVNQSLLDLHKLSTERTDPHLCDFLESHYLDEQVKMIKKLGDHITNLKRLGAPENGMGVYLFDKHSLH
ncbi:ferritin heavy chain B-like isoform X1 [Heptranchias perlo]|uniref:ferritin heavy chain B-like isoform X1 n=1 Tax=Heptranchias perlo TaxID=212740 RepID=UPI00355A3803